MPYAAFLLSLMTLVMLRKPSRSTCSLQREPHAVHPPISRGDHFFPSIFLPWARVYGPPKKYNDARIDQQTSAKLLLRQATKLSRSGVLKSPVPHRWHTRRGRALRRRGASREAAGDGPLPGSCTYAPRIPSFLVDFHLAGTALRVWAQPIRLYPLKKIDHVRAELLLQFSHHFRGQYRTRFAQAVYVECLSIGSVELYNKWAAKIFVLCGLKIM